MCAASARSSRPTDARVDCPRCGYLLVGEVASWTTICPLAGRCTECGLDFAWADVFDPDRQGPRWCIEFASGRTPTMHGLVLLRACLSTWRRALWPRTFFRKIELTHRVQPWRLALYACFVVVLAYVIFCLTQGILVYLGSGVPIGVGGSRMARLGVAARAVRLPLSSAGGWRSPVDYLIGAPERYVWPAWYVLAAIAQPLTFLLLRASIREARVRGRHLARVAIYSFSWLPVIVAVVGLPMLGQGLGLWRVRGLSGSVTSSVHWILPLFLVIPGWVATRRYLRMRHALAVAVATAVLAALLAFAAVFLLFRDELEEILFW